VSPHFKCLFSINPICSHPPNRILSSHADKRPVEQMDAKRHGIVGTVCIYMRAVEVK
jgi:hypothetical protein